MKTNNLLWARKLKKVRKSIENTKDSHCVLNSHDLANWQIPPVHMELTNRRLLLVSKNSHVTLGIVKWFHVSRKYLPKVLNESVIKQ